MLDWRIHELFEMTDFVITSYLSEKNFISAIYGRNVILAIIHALVIGILHGVIYESG